MPLVLTDISLAARPIIALSILFLTACTGIPVDRETPRYAQLSSFHSLQNVPYFPQTEDQCGPASLATLLAAQGVVVSPEQLRKKLYIPGKEGAVTTEMIARARRYGQLVYPLAPEFVDILAEINAGNPVLVMQNLSFNWLPRWHFSVAIAYDLKQQTLSLRSGNELSHEVGFGLFIKTWRRANSWAIVIVPPEKLPATATTAGAIQAASQLEQVGETGPALAAYQSVLARWPDNKIATFGAGNTAYALGHYPAAERFFSSYLELRPKDHQGWNNLAYTLVKLDCIPEAVTAINCALQLEPENANLLRSFKEIKLNQDTAPKSCRRREYLPARGPFKTCT